jgi:2-oxoglutarate dehydrogenase E2 component (dihydrolipoamide succinyltransferase)
VAVPATGRDRDLGFISPVVAKIASEYKVDLFQVLGTGGDGRITKKDILKYVETRETAPPEAMPIYTTPTKSVPAPSITKPPTVPSAIPGDVLPLTPVRKAIAEHMVMSKHTSPHVTTVMEVDLSKVVAHRSANKDIFSRDGVNLTFTAYFVSATSAALKAYPIVNSSWSDQGVVLHRAINIGMATSLGEEGLIVPVIKDADGLSLLGIARTVNDLANRARTKKLQPDEVKGGTFTITNHGISGSLFASPIINQPQCGILGVGAIQKRVVVISDENLGDIIAIRPMAYITLTFDHRILDGAIADYFLAKVVESLQQF